MSAQQLLQAVAVTAELTQTQMSNIAQAAMVEELLSCDFNAVITALVRCRRELRNGGFTLGAVMERIDDGRPGPDEAWAIAMEAQDEAVTVVWCDEIREAFAVARPVLSDGDKTGARMAFKNAYERLVRDAKVQNKPARWSPSLGWDADHRRAVLTQAVETGKLSAQSVAGLLPAPAGVGPVVALLLGNSAGGTLRLASANGEALPAGQSAEIARRCEEIRANLTRAREESEQRRLAEVAAKRAEFETRRAAALAAVAERAREQA
jgi:hypothetical protein